MSPKTISHKPKTIMVKCQQLDSLTEVYGSLVLLVLK